MKFIEVISDCKEKGKIKRYINCNQITVLFPLEKSEIDNTLNKSRIWFVDSTYIDVIEPYDELIYKMSIWQH